MARHERKMHVIWLGLSRGNTVPDFLKMKKSAVASAQALAKNKAASFARITLARGCSWRLKALIAAISKLEQIWAGNDTNATITLIHGKRVIIAGGVFCIDDSDTWTESYKIMVTLTTFFRKILQEGGFEMD